MPFLEEKDGVRYGRVVLFHASFAPHSLDGSKQWPENGDANCPLITYLPRLGAGVSAQWRTAWWWVDMPSLPAKCTEYDVAALDIPKASIPLFMDSHPTE